MVLGGGIANTFSPRAAASALAARPETARGGAQVERRLAEHGGVWLPETW
jgi:hypothetical protein